MSAGESYFQVTVDEDATPVVVRASGELDAASAETLGTALSAALASGRGVALDLAAVAFIDSSGLRVIAGALQHAQDSSQTFAVSAASDPVRRIFEMTGLITLIAS